MAFLHGTDSTILPRDHRGRGNKVGSDVVDAATLIV